MKEYSLLCWIIAVCLLFQGCVTTRINKELVAVENAMQLSPKSEYLKVHMNDGTLYVLNSWNINGESRMIEGRGTYYNIRRNPVTQTSMAESDFLIYFDDIALLETNNVKKSSVAAIAAMSVVSIPHTFLSIICLTDPKACFGSCPTFYVYDGKEFQLQAEGFSSSIARSLEDTDIDKLYLAKPQSDEFTLRVTNEALETHAVRQANLLACRAGEGQEVFATPENAFYTVDTLYTPDWCFSPEGDITGLISYLDKQERFSLADSTDLAACEELSVHFSGLPPGRYGLVTGSRQTLLTTFLFYQSLANMGNNVARYGLRLENGDDRIRKYANRMYDLLGGIDISVDCGDGKPEHIYELREMGPIATDVQLIELPEFSPGEISVRLKMTKGLWRLDYIALARLDKEVEPVRIAPGRVICEGSDDPVSLQNLLSPENYFVTYPREEYELIYDLPEDFIEYRYFLESTGYYYEWRREEWVRDENRKLFRMMFLRPRHYLKKMAPEFKKREPYMEEIFWNSRYEK